MTAPRCTCSKFSNAPDRWCEKHNPKPATINNVSVVAFERAIRREWVRAIAEATDENMMGLP